MGAACSLQPAAPARAASRDGIFKARACVLHVHVHALPIERASEAVREVSRKCTVPAWCAASTSASSLGYTHGTVGRVHAGASAVARVCAAPRGACTARTHAATTRLCRVVCSHPL